MDYALGFAYKQVFEGVKLLEDPEVEVQRFGRLCTSRVVIDGPRIKPLLATGRGETTGACEDLYYKSCDTHFETALGLLSPLRDFTWLEN